MFETPFGRIAVALSHISSAIALQLHSDQQAQLNQAIQDLKDAEADFQGKLQSSITDAANAAVAAAVANMSTSQFASAQDVADLKLAVDGDGDPNSSNKGILARLDAHDADLSELDDDLSKLADQVEGIATAATPQPPADPGSSGSTDSGSGTSPLTSGVVSGGSATDPGTSDSGSGASLPSSDQTSSSGTTVVVVDGGTSEPSPIPDPNVTSSTPAPGDDPLLNQGEAPPNPPATVTEDNVLTGES